MTQRWMKRALWLVVIAGLSSCPAPTPTPMGVDGIWDSSQWDSAAVWK